MAVFVLLLSSVTFDYIVHFYIHLFLVFTKVMLTTAKPVAVRQIVHPHLNDPLVTLVFYLKLYSGSVTALYSTFRLNIEEGWLIWYTC